MSGDAVSTTRPAPTASIFPTSVVWATTTFNLSPTENVMENGSSESDNQNLGEGYDDENESSSVIPIVNAEVVTGGKSGQTNAEATDSPGKSYVHVVLNLIIKY